MRKKTVASSKNGNIKKTFKDAKGLGIDKEKTMGIRTSPKLLEDFIRYASLPKNGGKYEFRDIVLNFEEQKIWYASKSSVPYYISSFGFAKEKYFEEFWGKGSVNISVKYFLKHVNFLKKYEKIIFWANPETNLIYMIDAEEGKTDIFNLKYDDVEHTYTATTFPRLGADYMPIPAMGHGNYIFGGEIDAKILKQIYTVGQDFRQNFCKINMSPKGITATFNDMTNPVHGAGEISLVPTSGTLGTPEQEIIRILNQFIIEGPAKNFEGPIEFRISDMKNYPLYLLKKRENGLSIAGVLFKLGFEE